MKNIGIIGIGRMGHALAMNLLKHGYSVSFYSPPPSPFEDKVLALGGHKKETITQVASGVEAIILCVTGTPEIEEIVFNQGGLLESIAPGVVVIDCSTAIPESTLRVSEAFSKKGVNYLDAAMTRTPKEAEEGRLNLLVGASQDMFNKCLPIFQCFAENIEHVGPVSYGHRLKLIHNFVSLGFSALLSEAVACANAANINSDSLIEVLSKGGGGGVIMQRFEPYIRNKDDENFRFTIANANKDINYYLAMASESQASSAIARAVGATYGAVVEAGNADLTVPQMIDLLAP
jgi:3-hydroxyisobutyrate dehydrogenase-like beta-hydroxyacid dehydrogenase